MSERATQKAVFQVPIEQAYNVITDYESYPHFVDGVDQVTVLSKEGDQSLVEFTLKLMKTFTYVLRMDHSIENQVKWSLESGDFFSKNEGLWDLSALGEEETQADYEVELAFKVKVPKLILNKLVKNNLPSMMEDYHKRMKDLL